MKHLLTRTATALLLGAGLSATALAAPPRGVDNTYVQERAVCDHIQQDRAACLREAGAARQAAQQGALTTAPDYRANALARCGLHPPAERAECEARITGAGQTSIGGSVLGGGLIRETVTTVPVAAPTYAPAPTYMPAPAPMTAPVPVMAPAPMMAPIPATPR